MRMLLLLALLLPAGGARAATFTGGDYAGAQLNPADGDVLSGVFTNVGLFTVPSGATVFVAPGVPLSVYASTVSLKGTLDASGRGQPGGGGGPAAGAGSAGFGGGPAGAGVGGVALRGGGGGGHGGTGGSGGGGVGAAGGAVYDSAGVFSAPLSADDVFQGSGGGGGGGGSATPGVGGASGGGAVYLEASSMTVTGSVLLQGATAATGIAAIGTNPGGGGGGSGGGLLLRITGPLLMSGARVSANGGGGGNVIDLAAGSIYPGGGGSGGRIKIFANAAALTSVTLSTAGGAAGGSGGFSGFIAASTPTLGSTGTVSFGIIASSPTAFAAQTVYITSISWAWNAVSAFGDGPSQSYRIFPATTTAPFPSPELAVSSLLSGATVAGLTPNTTYFRFVTAYTDWGDSFPSFSVSTHTLAAVPAAAAAPFTAVTPTGLTANWTAGSPAANPSYTSYELQSALDSGFSSGLAASVVVGLSSSPVNLTPNTTYYFRARAVNLDGVPTDFTSTLATATLAAVPGVPVVGPVNVSSAVLTWPAGGNPTATQYEAEVSSDNFFSLTGSSSPLTASATFFGLTPGVQYFFRVRAVNLDAVPTAYTTSISTRSGVLSDITPPSSPGTPVTDRAFSYDGNVLFLWSAAQSAVGILDYELLIGSYPSGNDVFNGRVLVSSYTATGLATGRTYYAQVRARSNAGTVGPFSGVSVGVPVFKAAEAGAITKPYAWPNPFDPGQGPAQIGFHLDEPADVVLKVYTLQGGKIRESTQHYGTAGNQILTWDGKSDSGVRAAPGGYILFVSKRYAGRTENQKLKVAVLY